MNGFWNAVREVLGGRRKGLAIGTAAGLFLGFLFLIVGFWEMIIFAIIVAIGMGAGYAFDRGMTVNLRQLGRWLADRWRGFN